MEPARTVLGSNDCTFVVAGGSSGNIYIWEAATGKLLRYWPAHYKAVTCLAFNDAATILITAAEDTLVSSWLLVDLLDCTADPAGPASPLHSWSEHTLPVTAVVCGTGVANPIVASASLDRSCHIRSLATGELLRSMSFPTPLHSAALDPGEHEVYLGGADGRIFAVSLVQPSERQVGLLPAHALANGHGQGPAAGAVQRGGASRQDSRRESQDGGTLLGHTHAVRCLAVAPDGAQLVSGCEAGSVRVWDLRTRQIVRVLNHPSGGPVTSLLALPCPPALAARQQSTGSSGPARLQPLAPLTKHIAMSASGPQPWEGPHILLDGMTPFRGFSQEETLVEDSSGPPSQDGTTKAQSAEPLAGQPQLEERVAKAEANALHWRSLYLKLHEFAVEQLLPPQKIQTQP